MIRDDIRLRIDQWLDGDMPDADEAALQQALEDDPELLAHVADRALLHGLLREAADSAVAVGGRAEPRPRWPVAWIAVTGVACVILAGVLSLPQATASPVAVVQRALDACRTVLDRRYAVRLEPAPATLQGVSGQPLQPRDSTLWARDARFVQALEVSGRPLVWGRDVSGAVWFAVSRQAVAVFDADEIPDTLRELSDLRTLDLETLLVSLLADFDLERTGRTAHTDTIVARPRAGTGPARFGPVELEIDRRTMLVRSVILERRHRDRAVAITRFTLQETASGREAQYEWRSHVDSDAEVRDRGSARGARRGLLTEFLLLLRRPPAES
jgi:hypothetical protein